MVQILQVSPSDRGEVEVAKRLQTLILQGWPDLGRSDVVRILVGLRVRREIDIAVEINLERPRLLRATSRRDGTLPQPIPVHCAFLVIEVKQGTPERFSTVGNQIFFGYGDGVLKRSVNTQVADQVIALGNWRDRYGVEKFFIGGMAWLTAVPQQSLFAVESNILGAEATWSDMLDGTAQLQPDICGVKSHAYRGAVRQIADILARPGAITPRDRRRVDALTNSILTAGPVQRAKDVLGTAQLCLSGRAGCGKSTALVMLAEHAAHIKGERVLILTYHVALCNELDGLVRAFCGADGLHSGEIVISPISDFLAGAYEMLFSPLPRVDGRLDYAVVARALGDATADPGARERLRSQASALKELDPEGYAFDYIFIDEAQDITDAERDFLRALYPPSAFVLGDGMEQLVRRKERCNWNVGVPKEQRQTLELPQSLRMSQHVASFINEVAIASGAQRWRIAPHPNHLGGSIVLYEGDASADRALFEELIASARAAHGDPADILIVLGHRLVDRATRTSIVAHNLRSWGYKAWDGANPIERESLPESTECVRVVQYDSARGLEGWGTVLLDLDQFFVHRMHHPNVPCTSEAECAAVARQWMLMALSRAAHVLVISLRDRNSQVAGWMRDAAAHMPRGVVETR